MGQFSWLYSNTENQMLDDVIADSYLLVPPEFQDKYGKYIYESCYDGYGHFGKYDVYELIPEWNKDFIPEVIDLMKKGKWICSHGDSDIKFLNDYYVEGKTSDLRWVGILLACYDDDNERLKYPIKITSRPLEYENVNPSLSDPNQGWQ